MSESNEKSMAKKGPSPEEEAENRLLDYIKENNTHPGDKLPTEMYLCNLLQIKRHILHNAISRLSLMGLLQSRKKLGLIVSEPNIWGSNLNIYDPSFFSLATLINLLELRIAMEIGIAAQISMLVTEEQCNELQEIIDRSTKGEGSNIYTMEDEIAFHQKLYEISGNELIKSFMKILHPVLAFIREKYVPEISSVTETPKTHRYSSHQELLNALRSRQPRIFRNAVENHFLNYQSFIHRVRKNVEKKTATSVDISRKRRKKTTL